MERRYQTIITVLKVLFPEEKNEALSQNPPGNTS